VASIYDLKPRFQALLRPLCHRLVAMGVTANGVTLAALVLSFAHGVWLAVEPGARPEHFPQTRKKQTLLTTNSVTNSVPDP